MMHWLRNRVKISVTFQETLPYEPDGDGAAANVPAACPAAMTPLPSEPMDGLEMDVGFRDPRTQRLFNEHEKLEARYGASLALKAATRLAVLAAARDLSVLPSAPPIGFRALAGAAGQYSIDLGPTHRLRFFGACASARRRNDLAAIDRIEVLGIEELDIASAGRGRR